MPLNYQKAREYVLSQPFIEEIGFVDILKFNPYALPKESTVLDRVESKLGKLQKTSLEKGLEKYPYIKKSLEGLFDRPEGTFDIYLDSVPTEDYNPKQLRTISASLTNDSFFKEITGSGFHFQHPKEFLYLCHELRLKQEIARRLSEKYNLSLEFSDCDTGLVISSKENPTYKDINSLLNFCMAYHGVTNTPKFKESVEILSSGIDESLNLLAERLEGEEE